MSSKKKRRHKEYLERKGKKEFAEEKQKKIMNANSLEEMAKLMGIKLEQGRVVFILFMLWLCLGGCEGGSYVERLVGPLRTLVEMKV